MTRTRTKTRRENDWCWLKPLPAIAGRGTLKLERLVGGRMKQLVDADAALGEAFEVMLSEKIIEHLAVRLDAVGPEVVAHQVTRLLQALLDERQRHLGGRRVGELCQPRLLRLLERLKHRAGEPRVLLGKRAANAEHVHDREEAGALVIVLGHRDRIGKQPANMRMAALDERWRPRR